MKLPRCWVAATSIALFFTGCGPEVALDFSFPSSEAFVRTQTIQLIATPTDVGNNACPELVRSAQIGGIRNPAFQTAELPICVLHSGSITVSAVPSGRLAYIAIGRGLNTSGEEEAMLTACSMHDIYETTGPVRLTLTPTASLLERLGVGDVPTGCSIDEHCRAGCGQ